MLIFSSKGCVCLQIQRSRLTETILSAAEGGSVAVGEGPELFFFVFRSGSGSIFLYQCHASAVHEQRGIHAKADLCKRIIHCFFVNANEPTRWSIQGHLQPRTSTELSSHLLQNVLSIILVPKKSTVTCLNDYCPVALIPTVIKCFGYGTAVSEMIWILFNLLIATTGRHVLHSLSMSLQNAWTVW